MYDLVALAIAALMVGLVAAHEYRKRQEFLREDRQRDGQCERCGYDLRGSGHAMVCPECGTPFEIRAKMPVTTQPVHDSRDRKKSS